MPVSPQQIEVLPHAIFLQRIAAESSALTLEARLGQAAFLALRLVDRLASDGEPVSQDVFRYQAVATERFCHELRDAATEGAHLQGIVASADDAHRLGDVRLLAPALLAYAHFLEDELRLEETLDVLCSLVQVGGERLSSSDAVAGRLRIARVNRTLNRFDEAETAYGEAARLAESAGDAHSGLLSRIGHAECRRDRGNLPDAETSLREILADARTTRDRDIEARAERGIGVVLFARGQPDDATCHFWRAYELYEDEDSRLRALGDVGLMLLMLGDAQGAERALSEVVRRGVTSEAAVNAMIELMHCASYRRDRVGFARWRERCEGRVPDMPPNILADFYIKQGIGQARFGQFRRAEALMARALEVAAAAGLHEFEFRIERIKRGLADCEKLQQVEPPAVSEPAFDTHELREVSASLAQLEG